MNTFNEIPVAETRAFLLYTTGVQTSDVKKLLNDVTEGAVIGVGLERDATPNVLFVQCSRELTHEETQAIQDTLTELL